MNLDSRFDTYFVIGVDRGNPVVLLGTEIPELDRERKLDRDDIADMRELRHIIDVVSSDLHLRAIADTVFRALNPPSEEEQIKSRLEAAMAARMREPDPAKE